MNTNFREDVKNIVTRHDLARFLLKVSRDFEVNGDTWENQDIVSLFSAMSSWVEDMDGYYINTGQEFREDQPWKTFADIVCGGIVYA